MAVQERRIIFVTNSERGQANICLAVAYEFLLRSDYSVHIASFAPLAKEVDSFNNRVASLSSPTSGSVCFHLIDGLNMKEAAAKKHNHDGFHPHGHGFAAASEVYRSDVVDALTIWSGPEYLEIHDSVVKIIRNLEPDIIVMDPLFYQAIDACRTLRHPCIWLSPLSFKDHIRSRTWIQRLRQPALCSGYPYPVPWHLVIPNYMLNRRLINTIMNATELANLNSYRNQHNLCGPLPAYQDHHDTHVLLPATRSTDFPCTVPSNFISCGPILLPDLPCAVQDPDLTGWLSQRPTILINLGSHHVYDDTSAVEMVEAICTLLARRLDVQVLWKMRDNDTKRVSSKTMQPIRNNVAEGRVRVLGWLTVDPGTILQTGNVICMVHHGGANSYYEAIKAGVTQIILPQWFDHYDFAARVEYLGVGVWGSRKAAPAISGVELTEAFQKTLCDPNTGVAMDLKAAEIAQGLPEEEGRSVASNSIIAIYEKRQKTEKRGAEIE